MWWVPASQAVAKTEKVSFVYFRHCAYGGEEPKWSALLHFPGDSFAMLEAKCPGVSITHAHAPRGQTSAGRFATVLEAVYPDRPRIADAVMQFLQIVPAQPLPVVRARGTLQLRKHRTERPAAAKQPRGGAVLSTRTDICALDPHCKPRFVWKDESLGGVSVPAGSRTIRPFFGGEAGARSHHCDAACGFTWQQQKSIC